MYHKKKNVLTVTENCIINMFYLSTGVNTQKLVEDLNLVQIL